MASFIQKNYTKDNIKDIKVALIYYPKDSPKDNLKYRFISSSSYPHSIEYVFKSLSNSQNFVDFINDHYIGFLYWYEHDDVIYISANQGTLQWMFRGDLDNFPKIQIILSPPANDLPIDASSVLSFVDESVRSIMETLSCVNQILLCGHLSIALFNELDDALIKAAASSLPDPQLVNGYDDTISFWFKKSAFSNQTNSHNKSYEILNLSTIAGFATVRSTKIDKAVFELKLKNVKADNYSIHNEMIQDIGKIESIRGKLNLKTLLQNADLKKVVFIIGTDEFENNIVFRSIAGNKYVDESTVHHDESTNIVYVNTPSHIDIGYLFQNRFFSEFQFMIVSSYTTINTKLFFYYLAEVIMAIERIFPIFFLSMPHVCLVVTHNSNQIDYSSVFPYYKYFTTSDPESPPLNVYCDNIITNELYVVVILDSQEDPADESKSKIKDLVTRTAFYSLNDYGVTIFKDYTVDQVTAILRYLVVDARPRDNIDKVVFVVGRGNKARALHYLADGTINNIADNKLFPQTAFVRNISQGTVFVNVPVNCDLSRFFLDDLSLSVQILVVYETDEVDTGLFRSETILQNLNVLSRLQLSECTSMVKIQGQQKVKKNLSNFKFFQLINDLDDRQERSQFMSALMKPENFVKLKHTTKSQENYWKRYLSEMPISSEDGIPYINKMIIVYNIRCV